MAGDRHPWRDIYSDSDWQTILAATTQYTPPAPAPAPAAPARGMLGAHRPATTPWKRATPNLSMVLPTLLGELTALINNYNAIRKDDHQQFAARIGLLNAIQQKADQYIQALGANAVAKGGPKALDATNPGRLDPWIASLSRRAQKKAAYLAVLDNWVRSAKPSHKDPLQIMQDLVDRANSNARGDADEPLLSPTPYAKMEKVDPFHRNIVFFVQDQNSVTPYHNNPMAVALNQWLAYRQAAVGATATFYEWLENHPICTGTPQVTPGFDQRYKNNVQKVDYNVGLHPIHVVSGMGLYIDLGSGGGIQQLSTSIFPASGKGIQGGCAFAWDRNGALWVHEHASGFRHTSFTGGKKIRCSGMIRVSKGLVDYISEESGHYAPSKENLYYLVQWLANHNCMLPSLCTVEYHSASQGKQVRVTAADYLDWGRKAYPHFPGNFV
jgi:hypothetical protein